MSRYAEVILIVIAICILGELQQARAVDSGTSAGFKLLAQAIVIAGAEAAGGAVTSEVWPHSGTAAADKAGACLNRMIENGWLKEIF